MPKYIAVNTLKSIQVLKVSKILYLESSGRYTIIFTKNKDKIVACKNLGFYQKIFEDQNFIRVHNSFLVNLEFVTEIIKDSGGQYCLLETDNIVPISNRKFSTVKEYLHF
jgi:two-component system LytT family response regulator